MEETPNGEQEPMDQAGEPQRAENPPDDGRHDADGRVKAYKLELP